METSTDRISRPRKRTREPSPYSAPKRRRSRSDESRRDLRHEDPQDADRYEVRYSRKHDSRSANYDKHYEDRELTRRDGSRNRRDQRYSRDERYCGPDQSYRGESRRKERYPENRRDSRRLQSRDLERRNDYDERHREEDYSRRTERKGSNGQDKSRNFKRSRSRSYRLVKSDNLKIIIIT